MSVTEPLIQVLTEVRDLVAQPGNDFAWSGWDDAQSALDEIEEILSSLQQDQKVDRERVVLLFAPTGPIQELSLSSGWSDEFLQIAARFDQAAQCLKWRA